MTSNAIHFLQIFSVCLRNKFQYRCCISRENRYKRFVKIHMCFISYTDCGHGHDFLCVFINDFGRIDICLNNGNVGYKCDYSEIVLDIEQGLQTSCCHLSCCDCISCFKLLQQVWNKLLTG